MLDFFLYKRGYLFVDADIRNDDFHFAGKLFVQKSLDFLIDGVRCHSAQVHLSGRKGKAAENETRLPIQVLIAEVNQFWLIQQGHPLTRLGS